MGKCKTKAFQVDFSIFTHIPEYLGIFRTRGIFITLVYSDSEAYAEPWYIYNPMHIHNFVKHLQWNILRKKFRAIIFCKL